MKKNFYKQPKRKKSGTFKIISWVVFGIVVALFLVRLFIPGVLEGTLQTLAHPFWNSKNQTAESVGVFFQSLGGDQRLIQENEELLQKLEENKTLALRNRVLKEENQELLALNGRRKFKSLILAPILRRPPGTFYDTLIIDIGEDTGIAVGNRVVVDGSIVIGELSKVEGKVGTVVLFSAPGIETDVFIGTTTASVVAVGQGSGNFIVEVPRGLGIIEKDTLTLAGLPTLVFSEVDKVISNSTDPFEIVLFQNPVNINALRWVQVVTNNEEVPQQEALFFSEENKEGGVVEKATTTETEIQIEV